MNTVDRSTQLEQRLERERRARRQAEIIAERGMRELWETNHQLLNRVAERTAQIERTLAAMERVVTAWADEIDGVTDVLRVRVDATSGCDIDVLVDQLRCLADIARRPRDRHPVPAVPISVADELLARWQRPAARTGQLLTVETDGSDEVVTDWDTVVAVVEVLLSAIVRTGVRGAVSVSFRFDAHVQVSLECPSPDSATATAGGHPSPADALQMALSVARRLTGAAGGSVAESVGDRWRCDIALPLVS